jgi:hypothetical protein
MRLLLGSTAKASIWMQRPHRRRSRTTQQTCSHRTRRIRRTPKPRPARHRRMTAFPPIAAIRGPFQTHPSNAPHSVERRDKALPIAQQPERPLGQSHAPSDKLATSRMRAGSGPAPCPSARTLATQSGRRTPHAIEPHINGATIRSESGRLQLRPQYSRPGLVTGIPPTLDRVEDCLCDISQKFYRFIYPLRARAISGGYLANLPRIFYDRWPSRGRVDCSPSVSEG